MNIQDLSHEDYLSLRKEQMVGTAESILNGEIGVILGSRKMSSFGYELCDDFDLDFVAFIAVDSETDHLPVDIERSNWSFEALARKDIEIADAEAFYRESVLGACRKIIDRFRNGSISGS